LYLKPKITSIAYLVYLKQKCATHYFFGFYKILNQVQKAVAKNK